MITKFSAAEYRRASIQLKRHAKRGRGGKRKPLGKIAKAISQSFGGSHWGGEVCKTYHARALACEFIAEALEAMEDHR